MSRRTEVAVGIDFGTTNSSVALHTGGEVSLLRFPTPAGRTESFRSLLYLEQIKTAGRVHIHSLAGPAGIEAYLASESKGRLMQSLKSYLSSRHLVSTDVFGRRLTLEELIARMLRELREAAEQKLGAPVRAATVGRPVRFVGASTEEDDAFAVERLRRALELAGFETVAFEWEPVAAAYSYESTLDHDELILIGDFGGGTSDFSLLRVGPAVRRAGSEGRDLLGNAGVGIAGDAFDAKIVRHLVSPMLGSGSLEKPVSRSMPAVPNWVYSKLEHWHHLSFLRTRSVLEMLRGAAVRAAEPEKIEALIRLIEDDLGYRLHQAVQHTKSALSGRESAGFHFVDGDLAISIPVSRAEFEGWIAEELSAMKTSVDALLKTAGVCRQDIDQVFLTGGSSFVPSVRRIFESRFDRRVSYGNEFTSVAHGLALRAAEFDHASGF